jgi:hypothetical protein
MGNKDFVIACSGCPEWFELLKTLADQALELGVDGIFFDQMGLRSYPCHDESHGHPVPFVTSTYEKSKRIKELRDYIKAKSPETSFGIEWISDITAQHADYVHNTSGCTETTNDWQRTGERPDYIMFPEFLRYMMPDIIFTDREIRDDRDIERRVNMALLRGLRSDVEIYRCRALIDETPVYKAYLTQANRLREKYQDLILNGTFRDLDGVDVDNPEVFASSFQSGDRKAVILTQSHLEQCDVAVSVEGYQFLESDGLGDPDVSDRGDAVHVSLDRHALAVLIYASCSAQKSPCLP